MKQTLTVAKKYPVVHEYDAQRISKTYNRNISQKKFVNFSKKNENENSLKDIVENV